jgi:hypothetical protein
MFKHDTPDNQTLGPVLGEPPVPTVPATRIFSVRRWDPNGRVEIIHVHAHVVQHTATGGLIFNEYVIDPVEGPTQRSRRGFSTWFDFEEILAPVPSLLAH